jgi:hypothetical protein
MDFKITTCAKASVPYKQVTKPVMNQKLAAYAVVKSRIQESSKHYYISHLFK